jgi:hypothetical protein
MARRSTRQIRAPNRFGFEEEPVQPEIPDQPVNQADEQEAESDHMAVSGSVNDVSRGNQPPPVDLHQILAMQTHIIQGMVQNIIAMQQQHTQERQPHMVQDDGKSKLNDFLGSRPPEFSQTNEPIEADDWIKDMERKLNLVQCTPQEKTLYAAHQLRGPAADWWDNYCATHTDASTIVWTEFAGAFRSAHIPESIIDLKKEEFANIKQGSSCINEYLSRFNRLARYAPEDVDTDKKKIRKFLKGMDAKLRVKLLAHDFPTFQQMVDKSLLLEDAEEEMQEYKRRKVMSLEIQAKEGLCRKTNPPVQYYQGESQYSNGSGSTSRSTMSESSQQTTVINSKSLEGSNPVSCSPPPKRRGYKAGVECFVCHEMGHYSWYCPQKVKSKRVQPTTSLPNVSGPKSSKPPNSGSASLTSPPVGQGRLNHVQVETNEKVVNLEQVEGAGEEQVPQARAEPQ